MIITLVGMLLLQVAVAVERKVVQLATLQLTKITIENLDGIMMDGREYARLGIVSRLCRQLYLRKYLSFLY